MKVLLTAQVAPGAWLGGLNYYRSLISVLGSRPPDGLEITVATNRPQLFSDMDLPRLALVEAPWMDGRGLAGRLNRMASRWASVDLQMSRFARRIGAQLVTHAPPNRVSPCPVLFWMPDFQHRHLPEFFSPEELRSRDRRVHATRHHGRILLSSRAAESDFRRFYPELAGVEAHVLRFTPQLDEMQSGSGMRMHEKYGLGDSFFFLPNQFWRHKNHIVVVEALARLPAEFVVVCTGALQDHRGQRHVAELVDAVARHGLESRFRMLGVVPKGDMLQLMVEARAVINPSLFEGWSTTVEEAKALGKRLLLSDLPVHREQDPPDALFFDPHDAAALAGAMQAVHAGFDRAAEAARATTAQELHRQNRARFAAEYVRMAMYSPGTTS